MRNLERFTWFNHGWVIGGAETISWETQATLDLLLESKLAADRAAGIQEE